MECFIVVYTAVKMISVGHFHIWTEYMDTTGNRGEEGLTHYFGQGPKVSLGGHVYMWQSLTQEELNLKLHILTSISYITISHILSVYMIILHILSNILHILFSQIHYSYTDTLMLSVNSEHILNINNKSWSSTIQGLSQSYNLNILSAM